MSSAATDARIQVMDLRIRIERLAAAAFDRACQPAIRGRQTRPLHRLPFVLAGLPEEEWISTYRLIRLGKHVYRRTSDLLHSRVGTVNLSQIVIDEWRTVVERLERVIETPCNF
jgi:hypothetical protein